MAHEKSEGHRFFQNIDLGKIVAGKASRLPIQIIRSVLSSNLGFLVDFGLLAALVEFARVPYLFAAMASFLAGTTVVYLLSIFWVFPERRLSDGKAEYTLFIVIGIVGFGLNTALLWFLTERFRLHYLASKTAASLIVFFFHFTARKIALFTVYGRN